MITTDNQPGVSANSSIETVHEPGVATEQNSEKGNSFVDRVFTQIGFDKHFFDKPHGSRKPHFRTNELEKPVVLHIDDDVDLVDALSTRLRNSGFRVTSALDGNTGFQSAITYPTDCIVIDYDMPGQRGDQVIQQLKSMERTKDIPIVVLTAIRKKSLRRKMLSRGANVFMEKPFEFEQLHEKILNLISDDKGELVAVSNGNDM